MLFLKQSTAYTAQIGPFLDSTDGVTAETALTIAQADVRLSKNGAAYAQKGDATSCTHDENGWYRCPLSTTDTGTLGKLQLSVQESGALPVWHEFMVVPANVYDSLVGGSDNLEVDAVAISGDSGAADNMEADYDGTGYTKTNSQVGLIDNAIGVAKIQANAIGASELATDAVQEIRDAILADSTPFNGADIPAILTDTNELQTDDVPGLIAALNDLSAAQVNAEVDTALADVDLDHLIQVSAGAEEPTDGSYLDQVMHKDAGQTFDPTTDSLEAIRDKQTDIETDTAEIGAAGAGLTAVVWNAAWDAEVQSEVADALSAYDPPTYDEILAFVQLLARSDAAINTDRSTELSAINANEGSGAGDFDNQVDGQEAIRDHVGDGTNLTEAGGTGDQLTAIPWNGAWDAEVESEVDDALGAGGADLTAVPWNPAWDAEVQSEVADALDVAIPGVPAADSINQRIKALDELLESGGSGDAAAILADTGELQTDDVPGLIAALNDLSAAEVNAQVLDVLNVDTFAMLGQAAPSATPTLVQALLWLYKLSRNKLVQDATTLEVYDDAGTTVDQKATVSDDGTDYTRGEIGTGP